MGACPETFHLHHSFTPQSTPEVDTIPLVPASRKVPHGVSSAEETEVQRGEVAYEGHRGIQGRGQA